MKYLRKINKGLILTILVIAILSIYLVSVEAKRNAAKSEIEKVVKEYIQLVNKYAVLEEDMQKLSLQTIGNDEIEKENKQKLEEHCRKIIIT